MSTESHIGRGGGGGHHGGHGGGHHGGHGHPWGGGPFASGAWVYPFAVDDLAVSNSIDIDDLLTASAAKDPDPKALAKEIAKQLQKGKATVGGDLDLLDAEFLGEEDSKAKTADKPSGGGGLFGDFGISSVANLLSQGVSTGVNMYKADQAQQQATVAKGKASEDEQRKLSAAILADSAAAQAEARAAYSAGTKPPLPSASVDASAAAQAASTQARAGAGLSPDSTDKRIEAANRALATVTKAAQARPTDPYSLALVDAWQKTTNKIGNAQITGSPVGDGGTGGKGGGGKGGGSGDGGWLAGKTGPVPNKVIAGGGAVLAGALLLKGLLR